jgi:hypothetical protein
MHRQDSLPETNHSRAIQGGVNQNVMAELNIVWLIARHLGWTGAKLLFLLLYIMISLNLIYLFYLQSTMIEAAGPFWLTGASWLHFNGLATLSWCSVCLGHCYQESLSL